MEEWGSGYKRIVDACEAGGYPKPEWLELGTSMRVIFYPHPATQVQQRRQLTARQQDILALFSKHEALSFREIFNQLGHPVSERTLRYDLVQLKKLGRLMSEGRGPSTTWRLGL